VLRSLLQAMFGELLLLATQVPTGLTFVADERPTPPTRYIPVDVFNHIRSLIWYLCRSPQGGVEQAISCVPHLAISSPSPADTSTVPILGQRYTMRSIVIFYTNYADDGRRYTQAEAVQATFDLPLVRLESCLKAQPSTSAK
jgi:hypothetical protein